MKHIKPNDSSRKGDMAEYYAVTWLWDNGYEVFRNCGCTGSVDLIARDLKGNIKLIDVKTAQPQLHKETGNNILFMLVIASIIAPISEEIFFRFFVFLGLKNLFPNNKNIIAAIISSVFFALIHIEPGSYLVTFILGLGFCWLYIRTKNILIPIFTHSLHNTISVIMVIQL